MSRRLAREKALQALFQIDMTGEEPSRAMTSVLEHGQEELIPYDFLSDLVSGTVSHQAAVDELIGSHLEGWTLSRLSYVDRNILRLATYEMLYRDDIPEKVSVNEAIELSKLFSTEESSRFINGVLSSIMNRDKVEAGGAKEGE
ncbi:MAG: transcription antitermination factor NusB [Bacillaceae bacterium]|nr:transcription antitermination factor NusB [Bacillaceae bacterium]